MRQEAQITKAEISVAFEDCLEKFILEKRAHVKPFVADHFSCKQTLFIQKKTFLIDLVSNPINAIWSFLYLAIKKIIEILEKIGWTSLGALFLKIPKGIKTGYQKKIERTVALEFLDWNPDSKKTDHGLLTLIKHNSVLSTLMDSKNHQIFSMTEDLRGVLDRYSAGRALISDLSGSVLTLLVGWIYFGDKTLGLLGLGNRIAGRLAQDRAADKFFLGKGLGSSFYKMFPPHPSRYQIVLATLFVGLMLTIFSLITTALSDPCLKKMGLQEKKLEAFLDDLETILSIQFKRKLKEMFK